MLVELLVSHAATEASVDSDGDTSLQTAGDHHLIAKTGCCFMSCLVTNSDSRM